MRLLVSGLVGQPMSQQPITYLQGIEVTLSVRSGDRESGKHTGCNTFWEACDAGEQLRQSVPVWASVFEPLVFGIGRGTVCAAPHLHGHLKELKRCICALVGSALECRLGKLASPSCKRLFFSSRMARRMMFLLC